MRTIQKTVVGAFIFSADNKLLLGKSNRGTYEGYWIIPGGAVEQGESYEEAIVREICEETGIDLEFEKLEKMDLALSGTSKKILKDTGEEVMGEYTFINFVVYLDDNSAAIVVKPADDFVNPIWQQVDQLDQIPLPPPTITSLQVLGLL